MALLPLAAQDLPGFTEYRVPNEDQKEQLRYLERNIYEVSRQIETYYKFLDRIGLVGADSRSRIPLEATMRTEWGRRERKVYSETAFVEWNNARIVTIMLGERKAVSGSEHLVQKTWYVREVGRKDAPAAAGASEATPFDGISVNIVIGEQSGSRYIRYYNYRFFTGRDLREQEQDVGLPEYASQKDSPVIPVREPAQRIELLREYLAALRLLERRVNYLAYTQIQGEDSLLHK